jgi:hypothetical protein
MWKDFMIRQNIRRNFESKENDVVRPAPEGREVTFASGKKSCPEKKSPF